MLSYREFGSKNEDHDQSRLIRTGISVQSFGTDYRSLVTHLISLRSIMFLCRHPDEKIYAFEELY